MRGTLTPADTTSGPASERERARAARARGGGLRCALPGWLAACPPCAPHPHPPRHTHTHPRQSGVTPAPHPRTRHAHAVCPISFTLLPLKYSLVAPTVLVKPTNWLLKPSGGHERGTAAPAAAWHAYMCRVCLASAHPTSLTRSPRARGRADLPLPSSRGAAAARDERLHPVRARGPAMARLSEDPHQAPAKRVHVGAVAGGVALLITLALVALELHPVDHAYKPSKLAAARVTTTEGCAACPPCDASGGADSGAAAACPPPAPCPECPGQPAATAAVAAADQPAAAAAAACPECPPEKECPAQQQCPECPPEKACPACPPAKQCPAVQPCGPAAASPGRAPYTLLLHPPAGGVAAAAGAGLYSEEALARLWEAEPRLHARALQRGLYSIGDPARMRRFTHKLLTGACSACCACVPAACMPAPTPPHPDAHAPLAPSARPSRREAGGGRRGRVMDGWAGRDGKQR